jgi:hypothetical protein
MLLADCKEDTSIRAEAVGLEFAWHEVLNSSEIALDSSTNYHLIRIFCEAITTSQLG